VATGVKKKGKKKKEERKWGKTQSSHLLLCCVKRSATTRRIPRVLAMDAAVLERVDSASQPQRRERRRA
jgi:hypothetical protein